MHVSVPMVVIGRLYMARIHSILLLLALRHNEWVVDRLKLSDVNLVVKVHSDFGGILGVISF